MRPKRLEKRCEERVQEIRKNGKFFAIYAEKASSTKNATVGRLTIVMLFTLHQDNRLLTTIGRYPSRTIGSPTGKQYVLRTSVVNRARRAYVQ
jgi:hypothetical protein